VHKIAKKNRKTHFSDPLVTNGYFCTRQLWRFLTAVPLVRSVWNYWRCFTYEYIRLILSKQIRPLASKMRILRFLHWARFFEKLLTVRKMYRKKQKVTNFCWFILEDCFGSIPNAQKSPKKFFDSAIFPTFFYHFLTLLTSYLNNCRRFWQKSNWKRTQRSKDSSKEWFYKKIMK
jgi:hypothetical protein